MRTEAGIKAHFFSFALLVKDMRARQKQYAETKKRTWLDEARSLEAKVDKVIGAWMPELDSLVKENEFVKHELECYKKDYEELQAKYRRLNERHR